MGCAAASCIAGNTGDFANWVCYMAEGYPRVYGMLVKPWTPGGPCVPPTCNDVPCGSTIYDTSCPGQEVLTACPRCNSIDAEDYFIAQTYTDVLFRKPDPPAASSFLSSLRSGAVNRLQLLNLLLTSDEFLWTGKLIFTAYKGLLGRVPARWEWESWMTNLRSTTNVEGMVLIFINSPEYKGLNPGPFDHAQYVTSLYKNILLRTPATWEVASWSGPLDSGAATRTSTLARFMQAPENEIRNGNEWAARIALYTLWKTDDASLVAQFTTQLDANPDRKAHRLSLYGLLMNDNRYRSRFPQRVPIDSNSKKRDGGNETVDPTASAISTTSILFCDEQTFQVGQTITCTILARDAQGRDVWDASRFNMDISVFGSVASYTNDQPRSVFAKTSTFTFDLTGMQEGTGVVVVEIPSLNGTRAITGSPYMFTISGNCTDVDDDSSDGDYSEPITSCDCSTPLCSEAPQKRAELLEGKTSQGYSMPAISFLLFVSVCLGA